MVLLLFLLISLNVKSSKIISDIKGNIIFSKDSFNNRASYEYLNYPVPYGIYFRTFSLHPYNIQPTGFINMKQIVGQNIVVSVNDDYTNYYNSNTNPNNPYSLGIEFKILYTKYNILNVKNGNIDLTFYN